MSHETTDFEPGCASCPDRAECAELRSCQFAVRAALNYPGSAFLQAAWMRAVIVVRATKRGWQLDHPIQRGAGNA